MRDSKQAIDPDKKLDLRLPKQLKISLKREARKKKLNLSGVVRYYLTTHPERAH